MYHLTHDLGMCCGGTMEVFIEPLQRPLEIVIFGGGHVGKALGRQMKLLDYQLTVVDERPEFGNADRFPEADRIFCESSKQAIKKISFHEQLVVLIATHDHQLDQEILVECAPLEWSYLGMIGSRRKATKALDRLRSEGISEEIIARIQTPMGLDLGAQTPEEISVSIAAQIIAQRHGATTNMKVMKMTDQDK
jgi:xanthine dehydrogenase accessory factor